MKTLYIVRHAYAGQHGDPRYPDDSLRPLTERGAKQFRKVVKKLAKRSFDPAVVATSPYVRCRETADLVCERLDRVELVELAALEPGSDLDALVAWSNEQSAETIAWVGHAPDVNELAAALIGASGPGLDFAKGAVAAIDFEGSIAAGQGELRWFATPKILGC